MGLRLLDLSEDVLLTVIQQLEVRAILFIRQTCRRFNELTQYRSVWLNACKCFVIERGLPFPYKCMDDIDAVELERRTRRALVLQSAWARKDRRPCRTLSFAGGPLNGLQSVHFVLKRGHEWIITISEGIWPVIACWDLQRVKNDAPTKVGEWFCKGASIKDVVVDRTISSDASLAVSVDNYSQSKRYIEIQRIKQIASGCEVVFETIKVLETDYSPVLLDGDILIISDEFCEARVVNWRTGKYAVLKGSEGTDEVIQINKCPQVLFAHQSILVARSRTIDIFPDVVLHSPDEEVQVVRPLKTWALGWIDGIAISPLSTHLPEHLYPPLAILLRAQHGDPWASDIHSVKCYIVSPDPTYSSAESSIAEPSSPYVLPPACVAHFASKRNFMRYSALALGPARTSLWVSSNTSGTSRTNELWSMLLPSCIGKSTDTMVPVRLLKPLEGGGAMWTSMDYSESRGCIALGAVDGSVTVLFMVE